MSEWERKTLTPNNAMVGRGRTQGKKLLPPISRLNCSRPRAFEFPLWPFISSSCHEALSTSPTPPPPPEPESKVLFALLVSFLIWNFWFICSLKEVERIKSFKASTSASATKEKEQCTEIELLSLLLYFFWLCS